MSDIQEYGSAEMIADMENRANWWRILAGRHRTSHYITIVFLLIFALLAPLSAVTSAATSGAPGSTAPPASRTESPEGSGRVQPSSQAQPSLTLIGLSAQSTAIISLILTFITGLLEGLRRIFMFEQRWRDYSDAALLADTLRKNFMAKLSSFEDTAKSWMLLQQQEQSRFFGVAMTMATAPQGNR
jgi:hypothetical protein